MATISHLHRGRGCNNKSIRRDRCLEACNSVDSRQRVHFTCPTPASCVWRMITHAKPAYDLCASVAFDECGSPQHLFVAVVAMQHTYSSCSRMSIDAGEESASRQRLRICIAPEAAACLVPGRAIAVVAHAKFTNDLCASFAMHELDGPLRCISSVPLRCHAASKAVHALNCIAPLRCHAASEAKV